MTRSEIATAIRAGHATPGVDRDLFESVYVDVMKADHPDFTIKTLVESRSGERLDANGLPVGIHARAAAMFSDEGTHERTLRESRERPVSDRKSDSVANAPRREYAQYAPDLDAALAVAAANFLQHPEDAPKPKQVVTLSEAQQLEKAIPDPIQRAYVILSGRARVGG